jgi:hypothetical protein
MSHPGPEAEEAFADLAAKTDHPDAIARCERKKGHGREFAAAQALHVQVNVSARATKGVAR